MTSTLSADCPKTDPTHDLFGYAPFAKTLTKALCNHRTNDPLVLGLYGDWGSGKSTILKFICHNLKEVPEDERPIVIEFNPWWFSGQENLARAFLGQLQAALPQKGESFEKLRDLLGDFSEGIGGMLDVTGVTGGIGGSAGTILQTVIKRPPKDVPDLKEKMCKILRQEKKHIVIMVDDIDRLEAEEIRQLFTVIKALADFPNVIYLLAFDRTVVEDAIKTCTGMPGHAYLEKIVQVPFNIPQIERSALLNELCTRLGEILKGTPEYLFEQSRWNSIFYNGIEKFFTVPRHIVRFCNTLSVTYQPLLGEVNAVDFIAIESIRIFLPNLYRYIWENKDKFINYKKDEDLFEKDYNIILKKFVPDKLQQNIATVLIELFPREHGDASSFTRSRRMRYISVSEVFNSYFQFNQSVNIISNAEMMQWLRKVDNADRFGDVLLQAKKQGLLQVRKFLDRLRDYTQKDIHEKDIPVIFDVLFNIGDDLIEPHDDVPEFIIFNNYNLMLINLKTLAERLPLKSRLHVIEHAMRAGNALAVQCGLLGDSEKSSKEGENLLIPQDEFSKFKDLWLEKVDEHISNNSLARHQNLIRILSVWRHWESNDSKIKNWCEKLTATDGGMLSFIEKFISKITTYSGGSKTVTSYIDPNWMEPYIDVAAWEKRVLSLKEQGKIPAEYEEAATLFLQGVQLRREGKSPEDIL